MADNRVEFTRHVGVRLFKKGHRYELVRRNRLVQQLSDLVGHLLEGSTSEEGELARG